jgi:hypothetical protein
MTVDEALRAIVREELRPVEIKLSLMARQADAPHALCLRQLS